MRSERSSEAKTSWVKVRPWLPIPSSRAKKTARRPEVMAKAEKFTSDWSEFGRGKRGRGRREVVAWKQSENLRLRREAHVHEEKLQRTRKREIGFEDRKKKEEVSEGRERLNVLFLKLFWFLIVWWLYGFCSSTYLLTWHRAVCFPFSLPTPKNSVSRYYYLLMLISSPLLSFKRLGF